MLASSEEDSPSSTRSRCRLPASEIDRIEGGGVSSSQYSDFYLNRGAGECCLSAPRVSREPPLPPLVEDLRPWGVGAFGVDGVCVCVWRRGCDDMNVYVAEYYSAITSDCVKKPK